MYASLSPPSLFATQSSKVAKYDSSLQSHATKVIDPNFENEQPRKDSQKDDEIATSNTSLQTVEQTEIVHVVGDIIYVRHHIRSLS